ncbi:hypothetical protein AC1031_000929 [Aphanomyces cochlioides]|nr:hypothetical protein AC1031_000929 [Aphanomyces cochlioides]
MTALPVSPPFNNLALANDQQLNTPAVPTGGIDVAAIGREALRTIKASRICQLSSESNPDAELGMAGCRVTDAIAQFRGDAIMMPWFEQALAAGLAPCGMQGFQYHNDQAIPTLTNAFQGLHQGQIMLQQRTQQGHIALQQRWKQGLIALQQGQIAARDAIQNLQQGQERYNVPSKTLNMCKERPFLR